MNISAAQVKELREATGAPMMECKDALQKANGVYDEALKILRTQGLAVAKMKQQREAKEGQIISYIHLGGKLGVLIEINCETDFVAKNAEFQELGKNIAMQIAASNPYVISKDQVTAEMVAKEKEVYLEQAKKSGKPEKIWDKMVEGRIEKYYKEICLLEQPYIKDPNISVADYISQMVAKVRENITIRRFIRYAVGEKN
ncbi:MAG: translation elongation factor Ts [Nitrospirota bacterium]